MKLLSVLYLFLFVSLTAHAQQVSYPSRASLLVRIFADTTYLGSATGFVTEVNNRYFFITNWHVVTNREYNMLGMPLMSSHVPDRLWVFYNKDSAGTFKQVKEPLYDAKGGRRWHEFRYNDTMLADIVAFEISPPKDIKLFPVNMASQLEDYQLRAMDNVMIVGFPFGRRSVGFFPIYKQGVVASEPAFDYDDKPAVLIDSNTKPGMSGSPVYVHVDNYYTAAGSKLQLRQPVSQFIGVYAAQEMQPELGVVWKAAFIYEQLKKMAGVGRQAATSRR